MMKKIIISALLITLTMPAMSEHNKDAWREMQTVANRISAPVFANRVFTVTDYYNGKDSLYTDAINKAIADCSVKGGGMVVIPNGEYKTGPIRMRSNVNLHLSDNTILKFTTNPELFPTVITRIEGIDCNNISPLIYAYGEENIAVTGKGVLDGQADATNWLSELRLRTIKIYDDTKFGEKYVLNKMKEDSIPYQMRVFRGKSGMRPQFINLYKCKNILLEDFTLNRSPFWLIHPLMSENITVRRVKMESHGSNNDGCDPESCKDVLIEDCDFDTGDDCIAIKSGKDEDGRIWNIPSENIIVRKCRMKDGHAGVAIGSEITGGCQNVWVEDCYMDSPHLSRIIRIKSNPMRGGEVKNIYARNITVGECDESMLGIELKYWHTNSGDYYPYFHNIHLENITSKKSKYVLNIDGYADNPCAKDIYVENCKFDGVTENSVNKIVGAENIVFKNVMVNGKKYKY